MNSDTQRHTDSPVTGDGGVVWEEVEWTSEKVRYRMQMRDGKLYVEYMILQDIEDGGYEWRQCAVPDVPLRLVWNERQRHRQREAQLRGLVAEWRNFAIYQAEADRYADELAAILSPDDATGEVKGGT